MLNICIFSNKFDLTQATRVSHSYLKLQSIFLAVFLSKKQSSLSVFHACHKIADNLADTGDLRRKEFLLKLHYLVF
jgi:hypothetical protein